MNRKIAAIILLGAFAAACQSPASQHQETRERAPIPVKTFTVCESGEATVSNFMGEAVPEKSSIVSSPYPGTLAVISVKKGDRVRKGQVLARVESQTVRSSVEIARATLAQARDGYARVKKVYDKGSISQVQMVDMETKLKKAEASARAAEKSLEDCSLRAPYDGVVSEVFAERGVELGIAQPVISIMDDSSVAIRISVHENDINRVQLGGEAAVEFPALGISGIKAHVSEKNMTSLPLSHSYECQLVPENIPEGLVPGMVVKVSMNLGSRRLMIIPGDAVQMDREGKYVWLFDEGTARKMRVTVGGYSGTGVIISNGLIPGDKVICEGYQKVSSGMKVCE